MFPDVPAAVDPKQGCNVYVTVKIKTKGEKANLTAGIYGKARFVINLVRPSGLEPPTPTMSRWCSNQLSYGRNLVRSNGLEPSTPTMSRWCSNQLS
jgi:hypothetical protein